MALKRFPLYRVLIDEVFCILCGQKIVSSGFYNQKSHFMGMRFYPNKQGQNALIYVLLFFF
ncbi:hypothetical protein [Bartonella grahamii]|uniref:hypothetical protein n=1 Tax=Bartonella grahamii TaxID=33045 RepID=UPI002E7B6CA3|nr:hypothetical protein [Bartonella grahamii]